MSPLTGYRFIPGSLRVDLATVLDDIAENLDRAYTLAADCRPEARAPIEQARVAISECQRRAAQ